MRSCDRSILFGVVLLLALTACGGSGGDNDETTDADNAADLSTPVTIATPTGGSFSSSRSIELTANEASTIYYTMDGSEPDTSSAAYVAPISINASTVIKFFAVDNSGNTEAVQTETYTLDTDGDGVEDIADDFPTDPAETTDTDGDGVGDNADDFPTDSSETTDTDADGVGDNADEFPNDPTETVDTDSDTVGDNGDNCRYHRNPGQEDGNSDNIGDACDCDPVESASSCQLLVQETIGEGKILSASGRYNCDTSSYCVATLDTATFKDSFFAFPQPGHSFIGWSTPDTNPVVVDLSGGAPTIPAAHLVARFEPVATQCSPTPDYSQIRIHYATPLDPNGWELHLWGNALDRNQWSDMIGKTPVSGQDSFGIYFDVAIQHPDKELSFNVNKGFEIDTPVATSFIPQQTCAEVWVVARYAHAFDTEADANNLIQALGHAEDTFNFTDIPIIDQPNGLPANWPQKGVMMEIWVRQYKDSNIDKEGDINGLISKLDYLADLGVSGIWLAPITESYGGSGYTVVDYRKVEPDYGDIADFKRLIAEAHARGIGVIIDYVGNHSAMQHPLFRDSAFNRGGKRDWYVWSDVDLNWDFWGRNPWYMANNAFYYSAFDFGFPDFNHKLEDVVQFHLNNLKFWLNLGADGFRFDAASNYVENGPTGFYDQPETHVLLNRIQQLVMQDYSNRFIICEAAPNTTLYAPDSSCGSSFGFFLNDSILDSARDEIVSPNIHTYVSNAEMQNMSAILSSAQPFIGLRPYPRLAQNEDHYRVAAASSLLLPGTPFMFYGEEVGMGSKKVTSNDVHILNTAIMSWEPDAVTAGFGSVPNPWEPPAWNVLSHNVETALADPDSLYYFYKKLIQLRRTYDSLSLGDYAQVVSDAPNDVLAYARRSGADYAVVAVNYTGNPVTTTLSSVDANTQLFDVATSSSITTSGTGTLSYQIAPYSYKILVNQLR
jgi:glycosidase